MAKEPNLLDAEYRAREIAAQHMAKMAKEQALLSAELDKLKKLQTELAEEEAWRADKAKMAALKEQIARMKAEVDTSRSRIWRVAQAEPGTPRLGISFEPVPDVLYDQLDLLPRGSGVLITKVWPGSAAEKIGLNLNDVLVSFAGKAVNADGRNLPKIFSELKADEKFVFTFLRKGKMHMSEAVSLPAAKKDEANNRGENKIAFSSMIVNVNNGGFQISARNDAGEYRLTGSIENGKTIPNAINITHGDAQGKYDSLEKLPKEDRAAVEQLLKSVSGR